MCGIAGLVNLTGGSVSPVILKKMTDAIAPRGPDGEGQWVSQHIGLGHRRLAIIDLSSAGNQPMVSPDHRYVITYNGEIYNYRELRADLEAEGFKFRSQSDTEVLLCAISAWGTKALDHLNGMFAFAVWDKQEQKLLLARDRYGIKPLYYSIAHNTLTFGSEQKALLVHPEFDKRLDTEAFSQRKDKRSTHANKNPKCFWP